MESKVFLFSLDMEINFWGVRRFLALEREVFCPFRMQKLTKIEEQQLKSTDSVKAVQGIDGQIKSFYESVSKK